MASPSKNPFRPSRVEHEPPGFLWVSPLARRILSTGQPVYLGGARGSGKTSILRTLATFDQLSSEIIRDQLPDEAYENFSVLLRVPVHLEALFRTAGPEDVADTLTGIHYQQFARLLELHVVKAALDDLVALEEAGEITTSPIHFARGSFLFAREHLANRRSDCETPDDLRVAVGQELSSVQQRAVRTEVGIELDASYAPGRIISFFARLILPTISVVSNSRSPSRLKICIDECEFLSDEQQKYLNSLVRGTEHPISWVVAFVPQKFDRSRTIFPGIVLSGSDRNYIPIDAIEDEEFERLCMAVTALRLYYALPKDLRTKAKLDYSDSFFNLQRRLGYFPLSQLAYRAIKNTLNRDAPELLAFASEISSDIVSISGAHTLSDLEVEAASPPIHLAYALRRLDWAVPNQNADLREKASFKASLRKKARAGFLGVCRQFRVQRLPYAGYRIVIGLADKCIRDFLNIMAHIFDAEFPDGYSGDNLLSFVRQSTNISLSSQIEGVFRASEQKYLDLPQFYKSNIDHGQRMIDALGGLTRELQTSLTSKAAMTLPERGIFRVDLANYTKLGVPAEISARFEQVVRIGRVEGYLRDVSNDGARVSPDEEFGPRVIYVRLHRLLAPYFGFSYRGALHDVRLSLDSWLKLFGSNSFSATSWINEALNSIEQPDDKQEDLPFAS